MLKTFILPVGFAVATTTEPLDSKRLTVVGVMGHKAALPTTPFTHRRRR